MKKHTSLLLLGISFYTVAFSQDVIPSFVKDSMDAYVTKALNEWNIPGAAVGIVKNGKVVLLKGYGVRETGKQEKVDENTLFMIGSNTKAFTATALAILEGETGTSLKEKFSLNDKVQKWMPEFKLYDPWVAKETIVRDLLCHRLGFETFQGDFMYFDSDLTADEVLNKMSRLKPLYGFRSRWGYTNAAFMVAAEIIPKVTGRSWADFLKERLFSPLGMDNTLALSSQIKTALNKASAHTLVHGALRKIPYGNIDNMAAAGSISSSINDMSKWMITLLNRGSYNGKQVIPAGAINQTWTPNSILGNGGAMFNRGHFYLYGLGWFLEEYEGRKIVSHTGGVNGFVTSVTLVPEEQLGILVFTNTDANNFYEALKMEIRDAYLELPYRNYSQLMVNNQKKAEESDEKAWKLKMDTVNMKNAAALPLPAYAGNYSHPVYGKMNIEVKNDKLLASFEHHKGRFAELNVLGGNRFYAVFNDPLYGRKVWPFIVENEKVKSVTVRVADFVEFTPYEFVKE
jgi:CubicO group peptidase (beta-lactamase class C family)